MLESIFGFVELSLYASGIVFSVVTAELARTLSALSGGSCTLSCATDSRVLG